MEGATSCGEETSRGWRVTFAVSLIAGLAGGVSWGYGYRKIEAADEDHLSLCERHMLPYDGTLKDCKTKLNMPAPGATYINERNAANERGTQGRIFTFIGIPAAGLGVVLGALSLYKGFIATPERRAVGGVSGRGPRGRTGT